MASLKSSNVHLTTSPRGGRIASLCVYGQELLWPGEMVHDGGKPFEPHCDASFTQDEWRAFKRNFGFHLSGGDKTWIAPEKEWWEKIPPLDLDAGRYAEEITGDRVVLSSPVCRETGLQVERTVRLGKENEVFLRETIVNRSGRAVTCGIWNVSCVQRPFTVYAAGSPDQWRSYHWQDQTLSEPSVIPVERDGKAGIHCGARECFKFGAMPAEGSVWLVKPSDRGEIGWERTFGIFPDRVYAHGSAIEVFNSHCHEYGEVEVHSPLYVLAPGDQASFDQRWRFWLGSGLFPG